MTMPDPDPQETMAAELALGVLEGEERAVALRRMLGEPDFARDVERWRAHFATLFAGVPEVEAPAGVEERIATRLDPRPAKATGVWRGIAAAAVAIAASLALFVLTRPAPPPAVVPAAPLVAAMAQTSTGAPVSAVYDRTKGEVRVAAATLAPAGKSAQLWVIAGDGVPHSLGLLRQTDTTLVQLDPANRARLTAGVTLAVSVEPKSGSPTGLPTGPVVAGGKLTSV